MPARQWSGTQEADLESSWHWPGVHDEDPASGMSLTARRIRHLATTTHHPKTVVVVTVVGLVVVAVRRTTVGRVVVPTAAANHTGRAGSFRSTPFFQAPSKRPSSSIFSAANFI